MPRRFRVPSIAGGRRTVQAAPVGDSERTPLLPEASDRRIPRRRPPDHDGSTTCGLHEADDRIRIIEGIRELLEANHAAREALLEGDRVLSGAIDKLLAGQRVVDVLRSTPVDSQRRATQGALDRMNVARHELRLEVIEICLDEAMLPGQIAAIWGVSRQRIDRYVQEIRRRPRV